MIPNKFAAVILALFATLSALPVYGQSDRGAVNGAVTDPGGAAVAGAVVTLSNRNTGEKREMKTTGEGNFNIPELRADLYLHFVHF